MYKLLTYKVRTLCPVTFLWMVSRSKRESLQLQICCSEEDWLKAGDLPVNSIYNLNWIGARGHIWLLLAEEVS